MSNLAAIHPQQAAGRLEDYTVIDVRARGEYAVGHLPGAHSVPLDHLSAAAPTLRIAAARKELLVVCASGSRSASACAQLTAAGIPATNLSGGVTAWSAQGHPVHRDEEASAVWPMERQVRLTAGSLVVIGLVLGARYRRARWLSATIGTGLVFSAATNTCGMAALLAELPYNRPSTTDLDATLEALRQ